MGKTFVVAIGINQYQYFQSLSYAQQDAQAFWDFWTEQADLPPSQCLLLTDTSLPVEGRSTYPERIAIQNWIEYLSGDGQAAGSPISPDDQLWCFFSGYGVTHEGEDYLMPVEGDPANVEPTGISIRWLFANLRYAPTNNILVLLDMTRSSSTQVGGLLGAQTADLARQMEIPLILSCQPGQVSHETSDLRHGLFTQAVLEALRSGEGDTIASLDAYLQRRLPELCDHHMRPVQNPLTVISQPVELERGLLPLAGDAPVEAKPQSPGSLETVVVPSKDQVKPENLEAKPQSSDDPGFWRQLILACSGIAVLLLAGVFLTNRNVFTGANAEDPQGVTSVTGVSSPAATTAPEATTPAGLPEVEPSPSVVPVPANPPAPVNSPAVPVPANSPAAPAATNPANRQANQELLGRAKTPIGTNSASDYVQAIATARRIRPGEPLYAQAQQDIERWSQAILDIAEGRARRGRFNEAIAAARLVPNDRPAIYGEAQQLISRWQTQAQQQQQNQQILNQARQSVRPGDASSYSQAIATARRIPSGQPTYFEAQQSINQWSRDILQIAYGRASRGTLDSAIQAATLVPANTPAYEESQKAIAVWKNRLGSQR